MTTNWLGLKTAWLGWADARGVCEETALMWLERAREADSWLSRRLGSALIDVTEDEMRAWLHSPQARLVPVEGRVALSAFMAFLVELGWSGHAYIGIDPPDALSIDPPIEIAGWEIAWSEWVAEILELRARLRGVPSRSLEVSCGPTASGT